MHQIHRRRASDRCVHDLGNTTSGSPLGSHHQPPAMGDEQQQQQQHVARVLRARNPFEVLELAAREQEEGEVKR